MKIGDHIRLSPISAKGKNRLAQYGQLWIIKRDDIHEVMIVSLPETKYSDKRWIKIQGDKHFKIEEVINVN